MDIGWVRTANHLTIVKDGIPFTIKKEDSSFKRAIALVKKKDKKGILQLMSPEKTVIEYTKDKVAVTKDKRIVTVATQEAIEPVLADKIFDLMKSGAPYRVMEKFMANVALNPNKESASQLFEYLRHNKFPITQDGCFLAYKYVREDAKGDLWDNHSGKFCNNPGKTVSEDRASCNPNRHETCSRGLHVAAYEYASNCGGGSVMIEVKVNPKDVVSVPDDYNNQKMRTCRYVVLKRNEKEIKEEYVRIKSNQPINDSSSKSAFSSDNKENLESMTGQEIIDFVKQQTGKTIPVSPKSKKSIIKYAQKFLNFKDKVSSFDKIDISGLSGQQIIDEVKKQTGYRITLSPKSKKSIIKKAVMLLTDHGLEVIV